MSNARNQTQSGNLRLKTFLIGRGSSRTSVPGDGRRSRQRDNVSHRLPRSARLGSRGCTVRVRGWWLGFQLAALHPLTGMPRGSRHRCVCGYGDRNESKYAKFSSFRKQMREMSRSRQTREMSQPCRSILPTHGCLVGWSVWAVCAGPGDLCAEGGKMDHLCVSRETDLT